MGVPTAPISTFAFKSVADEFPGTDKLPFIFTPHPVIGVAPETLTEYIEGKDPNSGEIIFQEIIDALTKPTEIKQKIEKKTVDSPMGMLPPETEDNLQRLFYENGWTDGLPIILPTEERVQKMLTGTSASPDEVVCEPSMFNPASRTVANVATVAVMAGARPEHFPVILAIAASGQPAIMGSTTPFAAMLMVNGPIRNEIGMNSGVGAFSPLNIANSTIGRAWTLLNHVQGNNRPKETFWSSQGNGIAYNNLCIAENEERSVWEPFHVQKGFKAEESTVSMFRGWTFQHSMGAAAFRSHVEEVSILLQAFSAHDASATLILDPTTAKIIKEDEGFATKLDFAKKVSESTTMTADRFWKTDYVDFLTGPFAEKGIEPYASWKKLPSDAIINPYHDPEKINIIVTGGETSPLFKACDFGYAGTYTIDKWKPTSSDECADGSCGLPDPEGDYDD